MYCQHQRLHFLWHSIVALLICQRGCPNRWAPITLLVDGHGYNYKKLEQMISLSLCLFVTATRLSCHSLWYIWCWNCIFVRTNAEIWHVGSSKIVNFRSFDVFKVNGPECKISIILPKISSFLDHKYASGQSLTRVVYFIF